MFLFRQFCIQFYGSEMWFFNDKSVSALKQFAVGYHKAIKKILGVSYHESNHYACQEARLFTFNHLINKIKLFAAVRLFKTPCSFIEKSFGFLSVSSVFLNEVRDIFLEIYDVESLFEQDKDALVSRVAFVQNHERPMREGWD